LHRWEERESAFRRTTEQYQTTQRRFLPFFLIRRDVRFEAYHQYAMAADWKWSTRATYWAAILAMMEAMGELGSASDKRNLKWLEVMADRDIPTTAPPLTPQHVTQILHLPFSAAQVGILVAWFLGQRLADVEQLERRWIQLKQNMGTGDFFISLTFVRGKVIDRIGPYTLFINARHHVALLLMRLFHDLPCGADMLFPPSFRIDCAVLLKSIQFDLESRSCRRGGLQLMALLGMSTSHIRMFSKHTSDKMLLKYLSMGQVLMFNAQTSDEVMTRMWATLGNASPSL
jgi:hypothetical protein